MTSLTFTPDPGKTTSLQDQLIARIEGHGHLHIDPRTDTVELHVDEGERLFEKLLVGRSYEEAHWITPRICGVCPEAHNVVTIKALEAAMQIQPTETSIDFRKLLLHGQNIVSHILHIFFLAAPDYMNIHSALDLIEKDKPTFDLVIELKKTADHMLQVVGGRAIHPVTSSVGGFSKLPAPQDLQAVRDELAAILPKAIAAAQLVLNWEYPELHRDTEYLSLYNPDCYAIYDGTLLSNKGLMTSPANYQDVFHEETREYISAKYSVRNGDSFLSATISRINLLGAQLHPEALKLMKEGPIRFPSDNPFHNTPAQALETISAIEESIQIMDKLLKQGFPPADIVPFKVRAGRGGAAIAAPRGILFNTIEVDDKGEITYADIVTPTAQNLFNLEHYANVLFKSSASQPMEVRHRLLEMLVRAYDPCVTCSVH